MRSISSFWAGSGSCRPFLPLLLGLYRVPLRGGPLFIGWLVGMVSGTWFFVLAGLKPVLSVWGIGAIYIAIIALALNLASASADHWSKEARLSAPEDFQAQLPSAKAVGSIYLPRLRREVPGTQG